MKHIRKIMALVFALVICLGMLPTSAYAEGKGTERTSRSNASDPARDAMLTFSADAPFTLATANGIKNWNGTLEYFTGTGRWVIWDGTTISSGLHNGRQVLYLRGTGNTRISANENQRWVLTGRPGGGSGFVSQQEEPPQRWQLNGPNITCSGNIECLLSYMAVANQMHPAMDDDCFACLFLDCTDMVAAPELPALELTDRCYYRMFEGCKALMFAPALPATALAEYCYAQMFSGCKALRTAPALPATTLADYCYSGMFQNCSSLQSVPELSATALAPYCYESMFRGCTALTTPSELPATYLPGGCYSGMFYGCTGIKLSSAYTYEYNVSYKIPSVGHSQYVTPGALNNMFSGTGGPFTGTPGADVTYYLPGPWNPADDGMLTFSSGTPFTLETYNHTKNWNGTLQYSTNSQTWTTWNGAATLSSAAQNGQQKLYLRGIGNTGISDFTWYADQRWVLTGSGIACSGNIENLLDYQTVAAGEHPTMRMGAFCMLFNGCEALITAPELPATTLADGCYWAMFAGCTSLTTAPELPATTLTDGCYSGMFASCTSLTAAPALPATTLTDGCYWAMFQNCSSLTTAPSLPATTLAYECYMQMFENCASLTAAPSLPATALADECYQYMFHGCTSLTTAPALPATTLAEGCYKHMFHSCTSLVNAPALPATTLADSCYERMFEGCAALAVAPALPAMTLADACCKYMFSNCTSLAIAPELPATTLADECYYGMFVNCTSLIAPPALPATHLPEKCYYCMFIGCTGIKLSASLTDEYNIPYRIPSVYNPQGVGTDALSYMFTGAGGPFHSTPTADKVYYLHRSVSQLDDGMLTFSSGAPFTLETANHSKNWDGTLQYSTNAQTWTTWNGTTISSAAHNGQQKLYLRGIGNSRVVDDGASSRWILTGSGIKCSGNIENLLDYQTVSAGDHPDMTSFSFAYLFYCCSALTDVSELRLSTPELQYTTSTNHPLACYVSMFENCSSLTAPPALPAMTVGSNCYTRMFKGCTSLIKAPALPATTLKNSACYLEMFSDCTSLMKAPALPATTLVNDCYNSMFSHCSSLTTAPALPATVLPEKCYQDMFAFCTSLTSIPDLPAIVFCYECCRTMFAGCVGIRLSTVPTYEYTIPYRIPMVDPEGWLGADANAFTMMFYATGGTFTGTPDYRTTYYLHYTNSIVG